MAGIHSRFHWRTLLRLAAAICLAAFARSASAQTLLDPTTAEFSPSIDHGTMLPDGSMMVDHYELSFYQAGASQPFQTIWLGKPGTDPDGKIRANFATALVPTPPAGVVYDAAVAAVGPTGVGVSTLSNPFTFSGTCSFSTSPTLQSIAAGATSGSVAVTTTSGCTWTAQSDATWLAVSGGASGSGAGLVTYAATANTATTARSATLMVAGQTVAVTQAGACAYTLSPQTQNATEAGGSGTATVTTGGGCAWSISSNSAWLTVSAGASGSGTGTVAHSVAPNTGAARSGSLTIAGQTLTVAQGAACAFGVSPLTQSLTAAGGAGTATVSTIAGCGWSAVSQSGWITVTAGASGSSSGTVSYTVAQNTSTAPRSGMILAAGQIVSVTQAGAAASCTYSVSPTSASIGGSGGVGSATVVAGAGCSWVASSSVSWISITNGSSGTASGAVYYSVQPNPTKWTRNGTLTVAGKTVSITQARRRR